MLFVLIAALLSIVVVLGLAMLRVAALSDESYAIALAELLLASDRDERRAIRGERLPRPSAEPWQTAYRKAS